MGTDFGEPSSILLQQYRNYGMKGRVILQWEIMADTPVK